MNYPSGEQILAALTEPLELRDLCERLGVPFSERLYFARARLYPLRRTGMIESRQNGSWPVWCRAGAAVQPLQLRRVRPKKCCALCQHLQATHESFGDDTAVQAMERCERPGGPAWDAGSWVTYHYVCDGFKWREADE